MFAQADEDVKNSLLYKVSRKVYNGELIPPESGNFVSDQNLFNYQAKVLKELLERDSYVVVGRCADYIFRDHRNVLNIYIYAKYAPGDLDSKQIMIDSSMLGVKGTAEVLAEIVQRRFGL